MHQENSDALQTENIASASDIGSLNVADNELSSDSSENETNVVANKTEDADKFFFSLLCLVGIYIGFHTVEYCFCLLIFAS